MPESILIVEDCAPIAAVLAGHLAAAGYRTMIAADGERALQLVAGKVFDCILLDLMLPGISGAEVFQKLRGDAATAAIPIVLVSAQIGSGGTHLRTELDAEESVGKPFTRAQLVDAVRSALQKKRGATA
jgi:CheY-like chemotaxis protein